MVIFGATGDLTSTELLPSLFELFCKKLLPERFAVIGFARRDWSTEHFREVARQAIEDGCAWEPEAWNDFARRLGYVRGDATGPAQEGYADLRAAVEAAAVEFGIPDNVFFHLAMPPSTFGVITQRLAEAGLASCEDGWRRLVIEKPFGVDLASALELDSQLRRSFREDQIYRIDHFLGKETVQNMLVFRFANPAFEPIWNRNYIDHVQITVAEQIGIGTRAAFYEKTGPLRDMVQHHLLQLLCMTAIEPPVNFDGSSLRDETVKILEAVNRNPVDADREAVRGQYGPGPVGDTPVHGYREEEGVDPASATPTFAAIRLSLDNWRWSGVPFYLRTGKRMARKLTEVAIQFKPTPHVMFPRGESVTAPNVLAFRLQPEEGIVQRFIAKQPGPDLTLSDVTMDFRYADAFGVERPPRAYAWLLLDVMQGDQTLFARADWINEAWRTVDPIIERWENNPPRDLPDYAAGSWGPAASELLMQRDGRAWRNS
jgi:glucose-6-phosphate 1-dehydrogenase